MSTWISDAARVGVMLALLSACVPGGATSSARSLPVIGGDIRVAAAPGYCVDRQASRDGADQAVVVMGRCSDRTNGVPAIVTVSVGGPGSAAGLVTAPEALAAYFGSEAGRAALSRSGQAASVRLRDVKRAPGRLVLHLDDAPVGETWRALIGLRGRLVSVSVAAATVEAPTGPAGRALMEATVAAMVRANPAPAPASAAAAP